MRMTVIGCSGSFAGPHSAASSYLISGEDASGRTWRIVLDMGSGALGNIQRHIGLHQIDGIFVTHLHPDHCIDLAGLHIAVRWDPRGWTTGRIPMWCPAATHEYLAFTHGISTDPGLSGSFDFHDWEAGKAFDFGPFTIQAFPVLHPAPEPYAIRVTHRGPEGETVLSYSGDSDTCEELVRASSGADLFLCEAAYLEGRDDALRGVHLTGKRAGEIARLAGVERLMLTHLPIWNDPEIVRAEAERTFDGPIDVAQADHTYDVVRPARRPEPTTSR